MMKNKAIRDITYLAQKGLVKKNKLNDLQKVVEDFSLSITHEMFQLIDPHNENDPIAKQFIPSPAELNINENELSDPVGDEVYTKTKGIVHRYRDRCLLLPIKVCPVHCRFCFRKEKIGESSETLAPEELQNAIQYIKDHPEIWEVIITGGDPFILKPLSIKKMIQQLAEIEHVEVIRFHTRVPVVDPQRINSEMIAALKCDKPIYVVLHANHPNEFSKAAVKACAMLVDHGIPMLSQTILLKNLNDNIETLSSLMRCFIKNRIKPYYLHQGDLVRGTQHFRTTIKKGQELMQQMRGRFSGICQPTYILDIPGGFGKVPIGPCYLQEKSQQQNEIEYEVEDYQGNKHVLFYEKE